MQGNTADQVIADGAFINPGAQFSAVLLKHQSPSVGTVLTIIDNTSANPIAGAFTNLPDGAIITVEGNNLRANYEGRDGNDLTLTVVP